MDCALRYGIAGAAPGSAAECILCDLFASEVSLKAQLKLPSPFAVVKRARKAQESE